MDILIHTQPLTLHYYCCFLLIPPITLNFLYFNNLFHISLCRDYKHLQIFSVLREKWILSLTLLSLQNQCHFSHSICHPLSRSYNRLPQFNIPIEYYSSPNHFKQSKAQDCPIAYNFDNPHFASTYFLPVPIFLKWTLDVHKTIPCWLSSYSSNISFMDPTYLLVIGRGSVHDPLLPSLPWRFFSKLLMMELVNKDDSNKKK